jgi:hypothetical protein
MKKVILTTLALTIVLWTFCQNNNMTKSFIYKTFDEFTQDKPSVTIDYEKGDIIKYSFPAGLQTRLKTKTDDVVTIYKPGDIWGYKEKGELYRHFSNYKQKDLGWEFKCYFKVIYNNEAVVYSVAHIRDALIMVESTYTVYYYSKDINSDIKNINDDNLNADFSDKPEIIKIIKKLTNK